MNVKDSLSRSVAGRPCAVAARAVSRARETKWKGIYYFSYFVHTAKGRTFSELSRKRERKREGEIERERARRPIAGNTLDTYRITTKFHFVRPARECGTSKIGIQIEYIRNSESCDRYLYAITASVKTATRGDKRNREDERGGKKGRGEEEKRERERAHILNMYAYGERYSSMPINKFRGP